MRIRDLVAWGSHGPSAYDESSQMAKEALDGLHGIQGDFFDLVKRSPLSRRIQVENRERFKLELTGLTEPHMAREGALFLETVVSFWASNFRKIQEYLLALPGEYIHVDQGQLPKAIRKYSLFFDGLLVSDQMLVSAYEHISCSDLSPDISGPLRMILLSAGTYLANEDVFLPRAGRPKAFLIPASRCLDANVARHWQRGSETVFVEFCSELIGRQFESLQECLEYPIRRPLPDRVLEPGLLKAVLSYRNAADTDEYTAFFREAMQKEQGLVMSEALPAVTLIQTDVLARISEFERFSADAYRWSQTSAIPYPNDLELYEWWARSSSRLGAKTLGLPYDESSFLMFAGESRALGFLKELPIDDVLQLAGTNCARQMRQDLHLSESAIRAQGHGSHEIDIESMGREIAAALNRFDIESRDEIARARSDLAFNIAGLAFSLGLVVVSQVYPPLSILSLLGGGTAVEAIKAAHKCKRTLDGIRDKPIAALSDWRNRALPQRKQR